MVIDGWKRYTVGELGTFAKGSGISREQSNTGKIPAVRYGELYTTHDYYIKKFNSHISSEVAAQALKIKYGNILFTCSGETKEEIGKCVAIVKDVEAYAGGDLIVLTPTLPMHPLFLGYALNMPSVIQQRAQMAQGDAIVHISAESIKSIEFDAPDYLEQERIAQALSDMDELISSLEKLIEKKKDIREGAMQELLTGKRRLPGFEGEWNQISFSSCFDGIQNNTLSRASMNNDAGTIRNVHYGDVLTRFGPILNCSREEIPYINEENEECAKAYLQDGDILIADTAEDNTVGKVTEIFEAKGKIAAGLHTIACRPKNSTLFSPMWLGYYMNSVEYHNQIIPLITGIKVSSISKTAIQDTIIAVPGKTEQAAIVNVLTEMDAEIESSQSKLDKYRQIKSGMMDELLTGKVRLV